MAQVNRTVTVHSQAFSVKSAPPLFGASLRNHVEAVKESSIQAELDKKLDLEQEKERAQMVTEAIARRAMTPNQASIASNKIYEQGKQSLFSDVFESLVLEALVLDDEFVMEHAEGLRLAAREFLTAQGGYKLLEAGQTPLLTKLKKICETTSRKVAKRQFKDMMADGNIIINFALNEEEKAEHDRQLQDLSIDQISELVRNKTVAVIKDEKTRQQKEKEIEDDLNETVANEEDEKVKEGLQKRFDYLRQEIVKETTVFGALMHQAYRQLLESLGSVTSDDEDEDGTDESNPEMYNTRLTKDNIMEDEYEGSMTAREEAEQHEQTSDDLDMDLVLAEAVGQYTLMETAHTMGLLRYDNDTLRQFVINEMNRR